MNNRLPSNAGVGVASILLIVVMLCMTVFASLSLLTAKNDATLTDKTVAYTRAYYAADADAQRIIADVAAALSAGTALPAGVARQGNALSFSVPVNESAAILVTLHAADEGGVIVDSYGVSTIQTQVIEDEPLNLWR
ncbi:MAG: hypothetical protein PHC80_04165 [Eubacteriales bacterium]|nr:hypothetical protein [Eubacteriales bacterium]